MMWCGTDEEYYRLYDVTAKHLKGCFPHLKIGGYASCGFYAIAPKVKVDPETNLPGTIPPSDHENNLMHFFYGFFEYIKKHGSPVDFFLHLRLTCDPVCELVQIPCIERNAVAAMRAINTLSLANFLSDSRKISFDIIVETMYQTGQDLSRLYRETSEGGLAKLYRR